MRLTVLGSAASHARAGQACAGHLVESGKTRLLFDCGNGALANLYRVADPYSIGAVFVTHNHPDHYVDLYSMQAMLRYAPQGPMPSVPLYMPEALFGTMQMLLSERGAAEFRKAFAFTAARGRRRCEDRGHHGHAPRGRPHRSHLRSGGRRRRSDAVLHRRYGSGRASARCGPRLRPAARRGDAAPGVRRCRTAPDRFRGRDTRARRGCEVPGADARVAHERSRDDGASWRPRSSPERSTSPRSSRPTTSPERRRFHERPLGRARARR